MKYFLQYPDGIFLFMDNEGFISSIVVRCWFIYLRHVKLSLDPLPATLLRIIC